MSIYRVSVVCVTYNQEKYIAEALESIVKQKTNFKFKVFVGDDASTDNTPEIIKEYALKYPEIIIPFLREKNIGPGNNSINLYEKVDTEYVAVCDGDDYWSDENKLQKQVDFLDKNLDFSCVFTKSRVFFDNGKPDEYVPDESFIKNYKEIGYLTAEDIIKYNSITPVSIMWRWALPNGFPKWYTNKVLGDLALHLIHAKYGKIGFIPEVTSCYRQHSGGIWQGINNNKDLYKKYTYVLLNTFINLREFYESRAREEFDFAIQHTIKVSLSLSDEEENNKMLAPSLQFISALIDNEKKYILKIEKLKKKNKRLKIFNLSVIFIFFLSLLYILMSFI